jgi:hypothetical protein
MELADSTRLTINTHTDRVERLFYGEDIDSIGTLFTNNQQRSINTGPPYPVVGHLQTPVTQNRTTGVTPSNSSIGGQSAGTTFTNEEATAHIIRLTNGFRNIETMLMAVMQQQGVPIPANILNNTNGNNQNNAPNRHHPNHTYPDDSVNFDIAMPDGSSQVVPVDPTMYQIDQDIP